MNGVVTVLKGQGFLAEMDGSTDSVPVGTEFKVYRVVDGLEIFIGTGFSRVTRPPNILKVNSRNDVPFGNPHVGDQVREVTGVEGGG